MPRALRLVYRAFEQATHLIRHLPNWVEGKDLLPLARPRARGRHLLLGNVSEVIRTAEPRGGLQSYVTGALLALVLTLSPLPWSWAERPARTQSQLFAVWP
jgi:hypothetical protein